MVRYGGATWLLGIVGLLCLAAFLSLLAGLAGILIGRVLAGRLRCAAVFWVAVIWVAKDLVVEKIFSGFPWCLAGYSQSKNVYLSQLAELGGIHFLTFLIIAANVLLYLLVKKKDKITMLAVIVYLAMIHAAGYGLLQNHERRVAGIPFHQAGVIQPNVDHDRAFDYHRIRSELERLFRISGELRSQGAEFVVWPEFTVPIYPLQAPHFRKQLDRFGSEQAPLLAGFTDYGGANKVFNSALLFQGGSVRKYDKVHLTPFGEYVPFRRLLFFVKKITDEIGDFTPGESIHNLDLAGRALATPICYEVIYAELVRAMIAQGGEVIVTLSNDSWFGETAAPRQHLAMAALRSIENRRWLLRSTSNGISALVSPAGRIVRRSPLRRPDAFVARFQYLHEKTVFTRWGCFFPYICLILVLGKLFWLLVGNKNRRYHSWIL